MVDHQYPNAERYTPKILTRQKLLDLLSESSEKEPAIESFTTEKGSVYTYLQDGRTQRYKTAENKLYEPMDATVFLPDYEFVRQNAPQEVLKILGKNEFQYSQILQEYAHGRGKWVYIVGENNMRLKTNAEIKGNRGPFYLFFGTEDRTNFKIPIATQPREGLMVFDTRGYINEKGERMRENHIGHEIVAIKMKK